MKQTVTLSVDGMLYRMVKKKEVVKPSRLLDIAMKAVLEADDEVGLELVVARSTVLETLRAIDEQLVMLKKNRMDIDEQMRLLEEERERLKENLKEIETQVRLRRLESLMKKLQRLVRLYEYDAEAVMEDDDAREIVERLKELRPDFDLNRLIERMIQYGG